MCAPCACVSETQVHAVTVVTEEPVELMEIERFDFDRILKADRSSERGRLIDFLGSLPMMEGVSVAAINHLSNAVQRRSFLRDQLLLAHPPDAALGANSFTTDCVFVIFAGQARLLVGDADGVPAPPFEPGEIGKVGPLSERPLLPQKRVLRHLGDEIVSACVLSPGEAILGNLLPEPSARWCLKPDASLDLLVIPRKEWAETLRTTSQDTLRANMAAKALFLQRHARQMMSSRTVGVEKILPGQIGGHSSKVALRAVSPRKGRASTSPLLVLPPSGPVLPPAGGLVRTPMISPRGMVELEAIPTPRSVSMMPHGANSLSSLGAPWLASPHLASPRLPSPLASPRLPSPLSPARGPLPPLESPRAASPAHTASHKSIMMSRPSAVGSRPIIHAR